MTYASPPADESPANRPRVLFVDDDPAILEGLGLSLRREGKRFEMQFSSSAEAALETLSERYVDVLVSGIHMPEVDGVAFLTEAKRHSPHTLRVVLCGEGVEEKALAIDAHRLLAKPYDRDPMIAVLEDALRGVESLPSPDLVRAIAMSTALPMAAKIHRQLMRKLDAPASGLSEVAELIESDPGAAARVLQLCNSTFFRKADPVVSIEEAVHTLGLQTLGIVVLEGKVGQEQIAGKERRAFSAARFQKHAHLSSELARMLLGCTGERAELAGVAALFQHVGRQAVAQHCKRESREIMWRMLNAEDLSSLEREVLGCSQADVGSALLRVWGLPEEIARAVGEFAEPEKSAQGFDAAHAVHVASGLAAEALGTEDPLFLCFGPRLDRGHLEHFGFTDSLEPWMATAQGLLETP